jgi:hypothetical protein
MFVDHERYEKRTMLERSGEKLDAPTVEWLIAKMRDGFDREKALKYDGLGSVVADRACMILVAMAPKDLLRDALSRHSADSADPFFRYALLRIARHNLPVPDALVVLGQALDDERVGRPRVHTAEWFSDFERNPQNRICDFAYLWMRKAIDKGFNVGRENNLEQSGFRKNVAAFKGWWSKVRDMAMEGKSPSPSFVPPVVRTTQPR